MFEFKDDDLFINKSLLSRHDGDFYRCCASNTAEDQLAELARLVSGDGGTAEPKPQQIDLVDTAPKLEFDLENELAKAFEAVPYASVDNSSEYDMNSIEAAFAPKQHSAPPVVEPVESQQSSPAETDAELSNLINMEFERALEEEGMGNPDPAPIVAPATFQGPDAATQERVEKNFEAELSKLMGNEVGAVPSDKTPPPPQPALKPWTEPEIVATPELPTSAEPETPVHADGEFLAPEMSDFGQPEVKPVVTDPVDEYLAEQSASNMSDPNAEIVFEGASRLAAAARDSENAPEVEKHSNDQKLNLEDRDGKFHENISIPEPVAIYGVGNRKRTGRKVAGSLVAVALLGGVGLVGWNAYNSSPTNVPTILASSDPVKVKPKNAGGKVVPNQDQAVFKSVESDKKVKPQQKRLADNTEKPIAVAKTSTGKAEVRVAEGDSSTTGGLLVQPRRVRTVVVKPDGTIINTSGKDANPAAAKIKVESPKLALAPTVNSKSAKSVDVTAQAVKEKTPREIKIAPPKTSKPVEVKAKVEDRVVAKKPETPKPAVKEAVVKKAEVKKPTVKKPEVKTAAIKKSEVKKPAAVAPKKVEPVKVAKVEPVKKAKVEPVKKAKVEPVKKAKVEKAVALPTTKSAYAVQISSQRSPEAAQTSYKKMARKYAAVIGGKGVDIRKAVINGRGTYYRVRIPAGSRTAANNMCSKLKSRGGDCLVTR